MNRIINILKNEPIIAEDLFMISSFEIGKEDYGMVDSGVNKEIDWLFKTRDEQFMLVGEHRKTKEVYAIDDDGVVSKVCDFIEDFPYEVIRNESQYTKDKTTKEYFNKYHEYGFEDTLKKYEDLCRKENIILDKKFKYHDHNGKLFESYFEWLERKSKGTNGVYKNQTHNR